MDVLGPGFVIGMAGVQIAPRDLGENLERYRGTVFVSQPFGCCFQSMGLRQQLQCSMQSPACKCHCD